MLGQMHDPTVVCHSCRFRSFRYLFPLNVSPLPVYLLLQPTLSLSLFPQSPLPSRAFSLLLCVSRVRLPRKALSRSAVFFPLRHVITVSTVACTRITYRPWRLGDTFFTTFAAPLFRDVEAFARSRGVDFVICLRRSEAQRHYYTRRSKFFASSFAEANSEFLFSADSEKCRNSS